MLDDDIPRCSPPHSFSPPIAFPFTEPILPGNHGGSHPRPEERAGGRGFKRLCLPGWEAVVRDSLDGAQAPCLAEMGNRYDAFNDRTLRGHLVPDSRDTYQCGLNAFGNFVVKFNIPEDIFIVDLAVTHCVILYFASYLRTVNGIKSTTIDKYVTHVTTYLYELGLPETVMRSKQYSYLIAAWKKDDMKDRPQRLSAKIPLSADLMWRLFEYLTSWLAGSPDILRLYIAAFSLGFGLGLRTGEYLQSFCPNTVHTSIPSDPSEVTEDGPYPNHVLHGESCFFKWAHDEKFYPVTIPFRNRLKKPNTPL